MACVCDGLQHSSHKRNEPSCTELLPVTEHPPFGWYLFPVLCWVGAELAWVAGYIITRWFACLKMVTHTNTHTAIYSPLGHTY